MLLNKADYFSWIHDQNLNDRNWVKGQLGPTSAGMVPDGPVAAAIVLIGIGPFWWHHGP